MNVKSRTSSVDAKSLLETTSGKRPQFLNSKIRNKSQLSLTTVQPKNNSHLSSKSSINISDRFLPLIKNQESVSMITVPSSISFTSSASSSINVILRCRPLNKKEKEISSVSCINFLDCKSVSIHPPGEKTPFQFSFDRVFDSDSSQAQVYEFSAKHIVDSVLEGFNGTVFAYGQTSSGKTFTMQGVIDDPELEGVVPRLTRYLFDQIQIGSNANSNIDFTIKTSIIEIYNERIKDLLDTSKQNLQIREDKVRGIFIEDVTEYQVDSAMKVLEIIKKGMSNRTSNSTNINEQSSRSHSIVSISVIQNNLKDLSAKAGKLYLVDLAGSEKISKTGATGVLLDEAKMINKSLTNLGHVINCLTDGKNGHIPYRDSKLTRVLQESLGGNAKTCLIITCSPSIYNESETLSTLRFGLRAKKVKNQAKVNKEFSIQELKSKVNNLEGQLSNFKNRVELLQEILRKNKLPLPGDNEEQFITTHADEHNEVSISINKFDFSSEDIFISPYNDNTPVLQNNYSLDENNILEINKKYIDILDIVNDLETEKSELEERLKSASVRLNESHIEKETKASLVKQLDEMKTNSELKAAAMQEKMSLMKNYMVKNKQNLSFIIEEMDDSRFYNNHMRTPSRLSIEYIDSPKRKNTFNQLEMKHKPEICMEILKKEEEHTKTHAQEEKENSLHSFKSDSRDRDEELNLLSTKPFSIRKDIDVNPNSGEFIFTNSNLHNNSPEYIINLTNSNSNGSINLNNNHIFEDFMEKLKKYSDKVPEINNLIETYKEKLQINDNKLCRKSSIASIENDEVKNCQIMRMTQDQKTNLLSDIETKVEKVTNIFLKD